MKIPHLNPKFKIYLLVFLKLTLFSFLILFSLIYRSPIILKLRNYLPILIILFSLLLIYLELKKLLKVQNPKFKIISSIVIFILALPIFIVITKQFKFNSAKNYVLSASENDLYNYGKHFIVGYQDYNEVKKLVEKRAIGGIFITSYNIQNITYDQLKNQIQDLQNIRKSQNLPPLFIATDQEGGIVSRLSPLVPYQESLNKIVSESQDIESRNEKIKEYALKQSEELKKLGFNLNFSPVVDLNHGTKVENDRYSMISQRAISSDPNIVSEVAQIYSQAYLENKVIPTLKHFPGLGRVNKDTHLFNADLSTSIAELENTDLIPFQSIPKQTSPFIMVGHAKLTELDKDIPSSFSHKVVNDLLREKLKFNGIVITDDFSMAPAYYYKNGFDDAVINSLNSGVDLILISYDSDLYFEAMNSLLKNQNKIDKSMIEKSEIRIRDSYNLINN